MTQWPGVRFDFGGKTVLVAGGSGGIGGAIARAFRSAGAQVVITGTGLEDGYEGDFAGMRYARIDVRDKTSLEALAAETETLDVLVNCVGAIRPGGRDEYDPDAFADILDVNLAGTFRFAYAFLPQLTASRGAVVNIASMSSYFGLSRVPAYTASKGGVVTLTKALAVAWAQRGVRVNAIAPGWIRTKLSEVAYRDDAYREAIVARTPMGRWAEADEMAGAVLFLCSPAAGFITGTTLPVDGGYSAA